MAIDEHHVALPKLYGAPAYARPVAPVELAPRPLDPDDLPIEAFRTSEEQELAETLPLVAPTVDGAPSSDGAGIGPPTRSRRGPRLLPRPRLRPRPLSLRAMAGRLRSDT